MLHKKGEPDFRHGLSSDEWSQCQGPKGVIRLADGSNGVESAAGREARLRPQRMTSKEIHYLLGHQAERVTEQTQLGHVILTVPTDGTTNAGCGCLVCAIGKSTKVPRRRKRWQKYSVTPGGVCHFDTAGPFPASIDGKRYAVIGIDEATGLIVVSMDRSKVSRAASKALRMMAGPDERARISTDDLSQ